jgi:hypothetical protein
VVLELVQTILAALPDVLVRIQVQEAAQLEQLGVLLHLLPHSLREAQCLCSLPHSPAALME